MNKNLRKIIILGLALGTVSSIAPATNINLLTTKAYASNSDADELKSLDLQDDDGDDIDLYKDEDYDDKIDNDEIDKSKTYYAESSTEDVSIDDIDGADKDNVRIFLGSDDEDFKVGDSISLKDGTNTLHVRVYEDNYDSYDDYDNANDADYNEYKIKVKYDEDDDNNDNDEDSLDSLELQDRDGDDIDLYEDKEYEDDIDSEDVDEGETYYAKTSSDEVSINIDGPNDDYVKIFKSTSDSAKGVDPGDSISVTSDKTLTVRIYDEEPDSDITYEDDNDVIGEYIIKLEYKEKSTNTDTEASTSVTTKATSAPATATEVVVSSIKVNQWVLVNGRWQYNDSIGQPLKSKWFFDGSYQKWYYLGEDGNMAASTIINGYRVGADGAWIK